MGRAIGFVVRYIAAPLVLLFGGFLAIHYVWRLHNEIPAYVADVPEWRDHAALGHRLGPAAAPVTAVVYSDYECPRSEELWTSLDRLRELYPAELSVVYRHLPLDHIHPSSRAAARAAVCGARTGQFEPVHRQLFAHWNLLDGMVWPELAARAGVADTAAFSACMNDERTARQVERDVRAADRLRARGAPLLLLNGVRFDGAPEYENLRDVVDEMARLERKRR
jgi:protein-disulfide isomerase